MQEGRLTVAVEFNAVARSNRKCHIKGSVYQSSKARPNTCLFSRVTHNAYLSSTKVNCVLVTATERAKDQNIAGGAPTLSFLSAALQFYIT